MAKKKGPFDDLFPEENPRSPSMDFATMFEQSMGPASRTLRVGDQFRAEILSIGKEESFVSTGTPLDAVIANADLLDDKKEMKYKTGEFIDVVVLKVKADEVRVARKGSKSAPVDFDSLEDAFDMELPVEGKVTEAVNGGYRVLVQGQSAFCPISQIDARPVKDPNELIGRKFEFLITQFEPKRRNLVVSRRKLLDLQKAENEGAWMQSHQVGDILEGTVTRLESFGAFVDLGGGVDGLVHVSEIGFARLKHASEGVNLGDTVQVKVLKIAEEDGRLRISLSIKQAGGVSDPWLKIVQSYPEGTILDATVDKKEAFGIFVVITPGVNGLLPKSKWRDAADAKKYEDARRGDPIKVRIDEIKFEERKISLGLPTEAEDESWRQHQGAGKGFGSGQFGALAAAFSNVKNKK